MATERSRPAVFDAYADEALAAAPAASVGKDGVLDVTVARGADGTSRLVHDYVTVPFHLTGGLTHDEELADIASIYVQSPTGGIAQGDRHRMDVTVEAGARAHVSTQSATKVLRMERNYGATDVSLRVGDGAYLEYLPDPTILYGDARYLQELTLDVGEEATALVGEVLVPGRLARGELFEHERYYSRVEGFGPDGRLFEDAVHLRPDDDPGRPGLFGDDRVLGTLYVVNGDAGPDALADRLHGRFEADAMGDGDDEGGRDENAGVRAGVTTLPADAGVIVRALGGRAGDVTALLHAAWDETREAVLGVGAPDPRKQ